MQTQPTQHDHGGQPGERTSDAKSEAPDDDAIRTLVKRLSRRHRSGGQVIERAAILAAGADSSAILRWIAAHAGEPEELAPLTAGRGLHAARLSDGGGAGGRTPLRYVLPAGALS
ncbi:MAG: hypothetical protein MSC31_14265 [Solirubrobacteraceae bacterium MAG38_C4-C5]|nr:hypothetical protein [Candidatus Siliceabacter maunaloa]